MTAISTQAHVCPEKKKKLGAGQIILIIVMMLFVLICTLPFINVIAMSMSSKSAILRGAVSFWPVEFNLDAYKLIVNDNSMWHSLLYTIELTVIYTGLAMIMTILVAFPLSQGAARYHVLHRLYHVLLRRHDSDLPEREGIRNA